jgi:hypothetical protein
VTNPGRVRTSARLRAALACAIALVFASGCAHAPRGVPSFDALSVKHAEGRARREAVLHAMRADVVLRLDGRATGRLPAFAASVAIASPDRARVEAHALLGVVLDASLRGDSVLVRLPGERSSYLVGGAGESLGVTRPVAFVAQVFAATWRPPAAAWPLSVADSSGCTIAWREGADSLEMAVDREGLPRVVRLERAGHVVRVRYERWEDVRGREFPTAISVRDDEGWVAARVTVEDLRFSARAEEDWFDWRMPSTTRVLKWSDIRESLRREVQEP